MRALVVLVLGVTAASAGDGTEAGKVRITKVSENIYKLKVNEFVNIVAMTGPEGALLVDSGFAKSAGQVKSALRRVGGDRIRYIVNTHADFDHVDGNRILGEGAAIVSHWNSRERLLALIDTGHPYFLEFPKRYVPWVTFDETVSIFLNSEEIVLMLLPGGHTDGDVVVYFKQSHVACLGDILIPDSFPVVKLDMGGDVETLIDHMDGLIERLPDDVKLILGHGRDATMRDLEAYREMLHETTGIIAEAMKSGQSCEDLKRQDLLAAWARWSGAVFEEVDSEMWVDTVCRSLWSYKK